jgi:hypothetical protein
VAEENFAVTTPTLHFTELRIVNCSMPILPPAYAAQLSMHTPGIFSVSHFGKEDVTFVDAKNLRL